MHTLRFVIVMSFLFYFGPSGLSAFGKPADACPEKATTYAEVFATHLQNNDLQKLTDVVNEWERECGLSEPVYRARVIELLVNNRFSEMPDTLSMLDFAIAFEVRYSLIEKDDQAYSDEYFDLYGDYFGYVPINSPFDRQIRRTATLLRNRYNSNDLAFALLTLYSGHTQDFFLMLRQGEYAETSLAQEYNQRVKHFMRKPELNVGVLTGLWLPNGDLNIIGVKPLVGVYLGVRHKSTTLDGLFEIRFGKTKNPFGMNVKDTIVSTRNHQGGYLGLEVGQSLISRPTFQLGIYAGAGYDILDMVEEGQDPQRQTFGSYAFQAGPWFEYVFSNRTRLGIKAGYSWLNHYNESGSPLSGNAFTVRLYFGLSENVRKTQNLKRLGY